MGLEHCCHSVTPSPQGGLGGEVHVPTAHTFHTCFPGAPERNGEKGLQSPREAVAGPHPTQYGLQGVSALLTRVQKYRAQAASHLAERNANQAEELWVPKGHGALC